MKKIFLSMTALFAFAMGINAQANTHLSNLSYPTAINHSLLPNFTGSKNLGSDVKRWNNLYLSGNLQTFGTVSAEVIDANGLSADAGGVSVSNGSISVSGGGISVNNNTDASTGISTFGDLYGIQASGGSRGGIGVSGYGNFLGVQGSSASYIGVYGETTTEPLEFGDTPMGVYGHGFFGVEGEGKQIGVSAIGGVYGLYASTSTGTGLHASTSAIGKYAAKFISSNYKGIYAKGGPGHYAADFSGNVHASGMFITSDMRLKKNIKEFSDAMDIINRLQPKNYEFRNDGNYATLDLPEGSHYGLLAQDLEKILPNLVKEESEDFNDAKVLQLKPASGKKGSAPIINNKDTKESINLKAVNYTELIPIMIKGMQELNAKNDDKDKQIADLQNQINELKSLMSRESSGPAMTSLNDAGYLKQNVPNPAKNNTIISYYLPDNTGRAQIRITDEKGSALKVYSAARGEGQVIIKSGELPAGTYNYTLYVNNKKIDSKRMVIAK